MSNILKNWKTSLAALITALSFVLPAVGVITPDQAHYIQGAAAIFGLAAAKDASVTGTATK